MTTTITRITLIAATGALGAVLAIPPASAATEIEVPGHHTFDDRSFDRPGPYREIAVALNPLGLAIGRVSFDVVWAPIVHHAIVVSPHFQSVGGDVFVGPGVRTQQTFSGFGGELGYRFYTGSRGMNGFFVGPSLLFGGYTASLPGSDVTFTDFGVAFDAGVQTFLWDDITVGAGAGLQITHVSHDFGDISDRTGSIASGGLKPRFLASAGYAF
jgi:hypothetical protein